ncbi:hypothetical protein Bbelb_412320 [Branchiostoma belcheri]|nr:hypothetical protein Bbelb_412320 [Branchiostoma belcheri]
MTDLRTRLSAAFNMLKILLPFVASTRWGSPGLHPDLKQGDAGEAVKQPNICLDVPQRFNEPNKHLVVSPFTTSARPSPWCRRPNLFSGEIRSRVPPWISGDETGSATIAKPGFTWAVSPAIVGCTRRHRDGRPAWDRTPPPQGPVNTATVTASRLYTLTCGTPVGRLTTRWARREGGQTDGAGKPWTAVKTSGGRDGPTDDLGSGMSAVRLVNFDRFHCRSTCAHGVHNQLLPSPHRAVLDSKHSLPSLHKLGSLKMPKYALEDFVGLRSSHASAIKGRAHPTRPHRDFIQLASCTSVL